MTPEIKIEPACTCGGGCHELMLLIRMHEPLLRDCIEKGLLSWRTTPSADRFRHASDVLAQLRWLALPGTVASRCDSHMPTWEGEGDTLIQTVRRVVERDGRFPAMPSDEYPDKDMALAALDAIAAELRAELGSCAALAEIEDA